MATYQERTALEQLKLSGSYKKEQLESALSGLAKAEGNLRDIQTEQAKLIQDYQKNALNDIARVEASIGSGSKAAQIRGMVDLHKLILNSPVDFAKAAYLPNRALLDRVEMTVPIGQAEALSNENRRLAWQTYYKFEQPDAGNVQGTYDAMVNNYGPEEGMVDPSDAALWAKRQRVQTKLTTERAASENFDRTYAAFRDKGATYETWAQEHNLDPNDEATREKFAYDLGLDKLLPSVATSPFIAELKKTVTQPAKVLEQTGAFVSPLDTAITEAKGDVEFWKSMIPKDAEGADVESADTFRDKLAAWVGRPETKAWAESQGLRIGQTVPLTERIKEDIAAGNYPGAVFTKYGVYIPAPDDMVAFRKAYRQLNTRPERQVFRAAGLTRGGQSVVEVDLKPPPHIVARALGPKLVEATKDPATGKDGDLWLGKLDDGSYVSTRDGETWEPMDAVVAQAILASSKLEMEPQPDEVHPFAKPVPQPKTFTGAYRAPRYGDAPGSVRFVNPESGKEEYIAPQDIAGQRFVNHAPGAHRPQPLDAVRKVATKALLARAGAEREPTPATGPAPTAATGPLPEPTRQAEPPKLPDLEAMEQAQREKNRAVTPAANKAAQDFGMQQADKALEMSRARAPLGNPPPETKVPSTTTPTASAGPVPTDALRRKFRSAKMSPAGTSFVAPPE
jgi:hypothetical protein